MPNFNSILKSEITRLARKEIKISIDPLRKANAASRREIAELKRQVGVFQGEFKALTKTPLQTKEREGQAQTQRFSSKGLKALRTRLGLSAADFGKLAGASGQSIYNWEAEKAVPRFSQQAALAALRGLGKREAAKRLKASA